MLNAVHACVLPVSPALPVRCLAAWLTADGQLISSGEPALLLADNRSHSQLTLPPLTAS
jgi:hypothetical protein